MKTIREAAVAGLFYPAEEKRLARDIDAYLGAAEPQKHGYIRAMISPHAGYDYSGPVAAFGYRAIKDYHYSTVILLAPSHYAQFEGAAVSAAEAWRTPLGLVTVSEKARALASIPPFRASPTLHMDRPSWSSHSPLKPPPFGEDQPETWEHSAEVQLPFLQRTQTNFNLIPVIMGEVDAVAVGQKLADYCDEQTLIVVSSDLSHYHPYKEGWQLDNHCVEAICRLDVEALGGQEACGKTPIMALITLAKAKGWKAHLLDYRNSGDTAGDKSRVVGYASIVFVDEAHKDQAQSAAEVQKKHEEGAGEYDAELRQQILSLARKSLIETVEYGRKLKVAAKDFPGPLSEPKGCFVTLTIKGALRGCIGHILPHEPLYQAVIDNARSAAINDTRFPALTLEELENVHIEVSVLTKPKALQFDGPKDLLAKLRPNIDGVVLHIGGRMATFLPQVWEQLPDKVEFLNHLSTKAGCAATAWQQPGTTIETYQAEAFHEPEPTVTQ